MLCVCVCLCFDTFSGSLSHPPYPEEKLKDYIKFGEILQNEMIAKKLMEKDKKMAKEAVRKGGRKGGRERGGERKRERERERGWK